jgi:two-component system, NarL family, invasion response regulator UvrY
MIKILIADDHPLIRNGLKQMLSEEEDMRVISEAENGRKIFELLEQNDYDLLILDLNLPDINGIEVLKKLKSAKPYLRVLVLSAYLEERYAMICLKEGAAGYINKMAANEQLVIAIRKVLSGEYFISPLIILKLLTRLKEEKEIILHKNFSHLEFEIMCLLVIGKNFNEISQTLNLSEPAVNQFYSKILNRLKIKNVSELIKFCIIELLTLDFNYA